MKKKIIRSLLIIGIISLILTYSTNILIVECPSDEINDFSNFGIYHDTTLVTSVNSDTHISMIHNDEITGDTWETFLYNFTNLGNFSDFSSNITIDYEYTGSMLIQAGIELGSNFFANGTYGGPNTLRRLFGAGIWDAWAGHGGRYYVDAYPNDVKDHYETADGTLSSSGIVVLQCNRTDDVVDLRITKQGVTQLSHTWSSDVSSPLNYIYFKLSIDPNYCTYTSVNFTSISVSLFDTTSPPPSTPPTTPPSVTNIFGPAAYFVGLILILNLTFIYLYRKRRN